MEHVRVREDRIAPLARERAPFARRVAVVQRRSQAEPQLGEAARLILRERLRGAEVEGARSLRLEQLLHERQGVGERLPAGSPGHDAHVFAGTGERVRLCLMGVQLGDPLPDQRRDDARIEILGQRHEPRRDGLLVGAMDELVAVRGCADLEQRVPRLGAAERESHRRNLSNTRTDGRGTIGGFAVYPGHDTPRTADRLAGPTPNMRSGRDRDRCRAARVGRHGQRTPRVARSRDACAEGCGWCSLPGLPRRARELAWRGAPAYACRGLRTGVPG